MEVVVEEDACLGVDDGTVRIVDKVLGHDGLVGVSENSLEFTFGGFLEGSLDFIASAGLFGANGQVDQGDIGSGDLKFEINHKTK